MDTMGDLLTNTIGAVLMGLIAYFQGRGKPDYFESYRIKKLNSDFYQLSGTNFISSDSFYPNDFAKPNFDNDLFFSKNLPNSLNPLSLIKE